MRLFLRIRFVKELLFLQTFSLLVFSAMAADNYTVAQQVLEQPVTLSARAETMKTVLVRIEQQTSIHFLYSRQLIGAGRRVSVEAVRKPLAEVLSELLTPLRLRYELVGDGIVLMPAADNGTVSGRVVDEAGNGLPGVTVLVEGTQVGNATNGDGSFILQNLTAGSHTLVLSFVGYSTVRRPFTVVAGQNADLGSIQLQENTTELGEAVVVGYGTARKQDVTGAIATVSSRDFVQGQVTSPELLIQGKVAGVQITAGGGAPGEVGVIRIRGGSSLNASNDPLIVIDGVPVENSGINGAGNPLALVNPNDIETFTVLKDASATAIYGSRASNGVIIITTKKGLEGDKMHVNLNSQVSRSQNYGEVDVLDGAAYRALVNRAVADGTIPADRVNFLGPAGTSTNWQKEIYQTAWTNDHSVSLTGSVKHMPYRASVGYLDQDGTLKTGNLKRNTASIGLSPRLFNDHLRIDVNVKGTWADYRFADQGAIGAAVRYNPTQPIYSGDQSKFNGYYEWLDPADGINPYPLTDRNPVALLTDKRDRSTVKRSIGNIQLDYSLPFFSDLHANLNLGYDLSRSSGTIFIPASSSLAYNIHGVNNEYRQEKNNKLLEAYLNYTKQLGDHHVEALAGHSYQDFYTYSPFYFPHTAAGGLLDPTAKAQTPFKTQYTLLSFYGRANYSYKSRYLLTATLRADASSHFNPEKRWGYFPAASVAWRINQESFLINSKAVSDLKLRVSYGITGQQDLYNAAGTDYPAIATYRLGASSVSQIFGNEIIPTLRPNGYDKYLKWEETSTTDVGFDYGFFHNRLSGSVDVYVRKTNDMLAVIPLPAGSNLTNTLLTNVGNLENRGIEFAVNYDVVRSQKLNWSVNFNTTLNRSKITKLNQVEDPSFLGSPVGGIGNFQFVQINSVGYAPNSFFLYQQKYENGKPIQGSSSSPTVEQYVDQNNDGIINERDKVHMKAPAPKAIFGLSSNVGYGKASLSFTVRANVGGYVYNNVDAGQGNYFGPNTGLPYSSNVVPNIYLTGFKNGQPLSDIYLQDASFVRLQNVTLGYDFGSLVKAATTLRVSLAAQNVLVLTKYTGLDPERGNGIDSNFYPLPRTVTLGLNLGF